MLPAGQHFSLRYEAGEAHGAPDCGSGDGADFGLRASCSQIGAQASHE